MNSENLVISKEDTALLIPQLFDYNPFTGIITCLKSNKEYDESTIKHKIGQWAFSSQIIAYYIMNNQIPKHNIYKSDKSKGLIWSNLSATPQLIRRTRLKSLPKGVSFHKIAKKFQAHILFDKLYLIGLFDNPQNAKLAYDICLKDNIAYKFTGRYKNYDLTTQTDLRGNN